MSRQQNRSTSEDTNPWRNEIVQTIFGDVGTIIKDFSCAIERQILLQGRMYVTDRNICFYSNLFGFEKKIKIPYHAITSITKAYTASVIPNAIAIRTQKKEYVFRSFWDREEAFQVIMHCYRPEKGIAEVLEGRPAIIDNVGNATVIGVLGENDTSPNISQNNPLPSRGLTRSMSRISSEKVEAAMEAMVETAMVGTIPETAIATPARPSPSSLPIPLSSSPSLPPPSMLSSMKERKSEVDDLEEGSMDGSGSFSGDTVIDPVVAFKSVIDRRSYKNVGVTGIAFKALNVKQWTHAFLAAEVNEDGKVGDVSTPSSPPSSSSSSSSPPSAIKDDDDTSSRKSTDSGLDTSNSSYNAQESDSDVTYGPAAVLGQPEFHLANGDSEIEVGEWKNMPESKACIAAGVRSRVRTYQFRTPIVGSPIGPSSTRATKTQCWRAYGNAGLIIESVIILEDIPYGDCFEVEDRWIISPANPDKPEEGGVLLDVGFEIKWKKSTLFKRAIEARSKTDTAEFYNKYATAALEALEGGKKDKQPKSTDTEISLDLTVKDIPKPETTEIKQVTSETAQTTPLTSLPISSLILYVLLFCFIIICWMNYRSQRQLSSEIAELKEMVKVLGQKSCSSHLP